MDQAIVSQDKVREAYVAELKEALLDAGVDRDKFVCRVCDKVASELGVPVEWVRHVIRTPKEVA